MERFEEQGYDVAHDLALAHHGLGGEAQALQVLEKAADQKSHWILDLKIEPFWDRLRTEPHFAALLKRIGLEK